jgi:hypothetical protein
MKNLFAFVLFVFLMSSCALTSTTLIQPNESFVLGDNEHGSFSVRLKNISQNKLELWKAPINGGQHSPVNVEPNETVKVKVPKNTALRIDNKNTTEASVEILVKGDVGLSMGYKKN